MRRLAAVLTLALVAGACGNDATAPMDDDVAASLEEMATLAWGVTAVGDAAGAPGIMARLARLPAEIALSGDQIARITGLLETFIAATEADRAALSAIRAEAAAAREGGATPDELRAILASGQEIRQRLHQAEHALHQSIVGVLTPAQRAWLTNRPPPQPRPCALTDSQRTEISGLRAAYEAANAADIALIRSVHERARAAHQAGASREQVSAILAEAHAAMQRLRTARAELHDAVQAVLTAEQRAAGCLR